MLAEYARALERIFDEDEEAHERASELLHEADHFFAPTEASLPQAARRHNTYCWRLPKADRATRAAEDAYEKLARIGYCGYGTNTRAYGHRGAAIRAAKREAQGEKVSSDGQNREFDVFIAAVRARSLLHHASS